MAVRCSGDCRPMEQVGEKQDFESVLTRHGMLHENFRLRVSRPVETGNDDAWSHDYIVTVVAIAQGVRRRYVGGPRQDWVAQFAIDVAQGIYGPLQPHDIDAGDIATARPHDGRRTASTFQRSAY